MQNNELHTRDPRYDIAYARQSGAGVPGDILQVTYEFQARDVHPANPLDPFEKRIIDRTVEFCIKRNISDVPDIYILDSDIPNAASVSGNHMIITTALLHNMNDNQLDAILGHELSHHRHSRRDLFAQAAIGLGGFQLAHMGWLKASSSLTRSPLMQRGGLMSMVAQSAYGHAGEILSRYLGAMLPLVPYRFFMEYEADKEGAELTSPTYMKEALHALETHDYVMKSEATKDNQSLSQKIKNLVLFPLTSHPPTERRIARLNKMPEPIIEQAQHQQKVEQPEASLSRS